MSRLRRRWRRVVRSSAWTRPTNSEIATVAKAGLAAGLAWWLARTVTDLPDPILAPLAAVVSVRVSVRASVRTAIQRSVAVVLGVFLALIVGDAIGLNGFTVGVLVAVALGIAEFVLHLPRQAATQVPISILVVLTAVASGQEDYGWRRAVETVLGAAVGVTVSLLLPGSRRRDARESLTRLSFMLEGVLHAIGDGLQTEWSADETVEWRRRAHTARDRFVREAIDAVGDGREAARWNRRDRNHIEELGRYEDAMPYFERTAIGISVIARGLDDRAHDADGTRPALPEIGALLIAVAGAVEAVLRAVLDPETAGAVAQALAEVQECRRQCAPELTRRARTALDHEGAEGDRDDEWLSYAALLVQVDRIVSDLSAPLPE